MPYILKVLLRRAAEEINNVPMWMYVVGGMVIGGALFIVILP
jgi:hypothetical protein